MARAVQAWRPEVAESYQRGGPDVAETYRRGAHNDGRSVSSFTAKTHPPKKSV